MCTATSAVFGRVRDRDGAKKKLVRPGDRTQASETAALSLSSNLKWVKLYSTPTSSTAAKVVVSEDSAAF